MTDATAHANGEETVITEAMLDAGLAVLMSAMLESDPFDAVEVNFERALRAALDRRELEDD